MTWQAVWAADGTTRRYNRDGIADHLPRGTAVIELDLAEYGRTSSASRPPLLRLLANREPSRIFTLESGTDGRLHLLRRHGADVSHLSIGLGREPVAGTLRLSYHWDTKRNRSLLTSENLTKGTIRQQEAHDALPVTAEEISALLGAKQGTHHPAIDWIGLANHWQTVGPAPGLSSATMIATPEGPRKVSDLLPGDLVLTADDGAMPILWQGRVAVPGMGRMRPVRLIAPYFGLKRDMIVQPGQRLALSGPDIEYQFAEDDILVEARHLINGRSAIWETEGTLLPCHGLLLDKHALISANGVWTETLFLARLARNPDLARYCAPSALGKLRNLPLHDAPVRRALMDHEALALDLDRLRSRAALAA